jgi:hypothetical protein
MTGGAGSDQYIFNYSDLTDDSVDIITDFTVGAGGDVLDLSALHTASVAANPGFTAGQEIYPYSHGYVRFIKSGDDTVVAYDIDGHGVDHTPQAVVILQNVNSLDFVKDNHAVAGQNFNISRNGVIAEVSEDAQSVTVGLRLWGGQPSDDVTVSINLPDSGETSLQLVFAPGEWHQTKSVTFTKSTNFDEFSLDNFSTTLSSNDLNYDGESLRYKTSNADNKSQIIGQIESQANDKYYAFEGDQGTGFSEVLQQNASDVSSNYIVQISGNTVDGVVLEKVNGNIVLTSTNSLPQGLYVFDVSYIDDDFNIAHERVSFDVKENNTAPSVIVASNKVVRYDQSLSEFNVTDDGVIKSVELVLGSGFSSNLQVSEGVSLPGSIGYSYNSSNNTITLQGNETASAYNDAIHSLRINDLDTTANPQKTIEVTVNDYTSHGLFENSTQAVISYIQGADQNITVNYWNGDRPIADVMMHSYAEIEANSILEFKNIEFIGNNVSFDIYCGSGFQNTGNFNFSFAKGGFNITQYGFSNTVINGNWLEITNETDTGLSVSAVSTSSSISAGDKIFSISLENTSSADINDLFSTLTFNNVTLGQTSDSLIHIANVASNSNASGVFENLNFLNGDHQFFLDKAISNTDSFLNSYDALLALKIAVLPNDVKSVDGIALDPMQFVAADFNQSGVVTSADVTAILKEIVKIDDDFSPEWVFVDKNVDYSGLARNNTQVEGAPEVLINGVDGIGFNGVIIGDVDGSWLPDIV